MTSCAGMTLLRFASAGRQKGFIMANENSKYTFGRLISALLFVLIIPAIPLFISGDWLWTEGWLFGIWFTAMCYTCVIYMYIKDPALLLERSRMPGTGNEKRWDIYVIIGIETAFFAWLVIMPLDAKRFGWSGHFPLWLKISGAVVLILSYYLLCWSVIDNPFASTLVRIQKERNQQVVSTGTYGLIRHPMYLGGLFLMIGAPMLMGSVYGLIIALLFIPLIIIRIIGEEKMLVNELAGYSDYKMKVKYRLIPFVW